METRSWSQFLRGPSVFGLAGLKCVGTTVTFNEDGTAATMAISPEILDKTNAIFVSHPRMPVALFRMSIGGHWKEFFTSLMCKPTSD